MHDVIDVLYVIIGSSMVSMSESDADNISQTCYTMIETERSDVRLINDIVEYSELM